MAVPKRKTSKSKRDMRSANKGLKKKNIIITESGEAKLSHYNHSYGKRVKKVKDNNVKSA